jgi:hypothetical protein
MDKRDIYNGNITLGVVILAFGIVRMFFEKRAIASINPISVIAPIFLIVIGLIGLKYLKK